MVGVGRLMTCVVDCQQRMVLGSMSKNSCACHRKRPWNPILTAFESFPLASLQGVEPLFLRWQTL